MGEGEILNKIQNRFVNFPETEESVVFLLSRIRKILEINHKPERYSVLNFYCNLALHSEIDKLPKKVKENFQKVIVGQDYSNTVVNFWDFHKQLKEFLHEFDLPNLYEDTEDADLIKFNQLLTMIYSDTPIFVEKVSKYKINIDGNGSISGVLVEEDN